MSSARGRIAWFAAAAVGLTLGGGAPLVRDGRGEVAEGAELSGRIAFVVERRKVQSIAVRDLAGQSVRLVRPPRFRTKPVEVRSIAWSPDAARFAYSDSAGRVYVVNANDTRARLVTAMAERDRRRTIVHGWSPDGRRLAVASSRSRCPAAGEPWLYVVDVARRSSQRLPTHPTGAPAASARNSAYLGQVGWSPDGSELLYAWDQYRGGGCRTMGGENRPTRLMRIRADGTNRVQLIARALLFSFAVSPSGGKIAVAVACGGEWDPLTWTADEQDVVIATNTSNCSVLTVDRAGKTGPEANLWPSQLYDDVGTVVYAVSAQTGQERVLWRVGEETEVVAIGTAPDGAGLVARLFRGFLGSGAGRLVVIPLAAAAPIPLPPLNPPTGTRLTVGAPVAVGFAR